MPAQVLCAYSPSVFGLIQFFESFLRKYLIFPLTLLVLGGAFPAVPLISTFRFLVDYVVQDMKTIVVQQSLNSSLSLIYCITYHTYLYCRGAVSGGSQDKNLLAERVNTLLHSVRFDVLYGVSSFRQQILGGNLRFAKRCLPTFLAVSHFFVFYYSFFVKKKLFFAVTNTY